MYLLYHMYNDIVVNTEFFKEKFINKKKNKKKEVKYGKEAYHSAERVLL